MRGTLIALSCGFAAAAIVLIAVRGGDEPPPPMQAAPVAPAPASAAESAAIPPSQSPPPPPLAPTPAARTPRAPSATSPSAALVAKPAPPEAGPAEGATFALSSNHQALIRGTLLAAADHDQLEREPRDDGWATETERLIRQELARHDSAVDFDVITVDCRQTMCAIQAFSNGASGHRQWVEAVDELYKESLASVFDSVNTAFSSEGSGRSPVLTFLHRKPLAPKR